MALIAIAATALAVTVGSTIYNDVSASGQPQGYGQFGAASGGGSKASGPHETAAEQAFYQQQTLNAELNSQRQADAAQIAANSTFEITSYIKWVLLALGVFVGYRILKHDRVI